MPEVNKKKIAIIGGGPSALFMYKRLIEAEDKNYDIHIFERKNKLGAGMPYSEEGASAEHITNVSDNEIPEIVCSIEDWVKTNPPLATEFKINPSNFNEYKVLPRLLFGNYLTAQFGLLLDKAKAEEIDTTLHLSVIVKDLIYKEQLNEVWLKTDNETLVFDTVIICIGHNWPKKFEGKIDGYYDSPYPPSKLNLQVNHPIAIKGSSLTAIDAIRTLSRHNGYFDKDEKGMQQYHLNKESEGFKIMMHSRNGFLPAIRFHLEDSHLQNSSLLTAEEIAENRKLNNGFLSLDYIFEQDFKELFKEKEPEFYHQIKNSNLEEFVEQMFALREQEDTFELFKAEYLEAEQSIKRKKSVYWKELLGVLSFAMNQPAKHFSAEDTMRLQKHLMPLISLVIAYVPQSSCEDLMALHKAGFLDIVSVGDDGEVIPQQNGGIIYSYQDKNNKPVENYFKTYIDCVGQAHLSYEDFPFKSFVEDNTISQALIKFKSAEIGKSELDKNPEKVIFYSGDYYLKVSGITINDHFQIVDQYGAFNKSIYIMAVPYISGFNPDYSGLDFCESASEKIMESISI
ncbi:hypothetical protein A5893_09600 [Pedobacter psychrophilus]|uniref:FAD-dependent urate hydroxylase HpyO/Asp monooxygenase CreE-like FAD/NAD(P)-binding domain-containing protein n=1 Tax=Pedobacter psychrophilus TaxID=1826909 RepID=A0A179DGM2_9SPHI|nr:FAD/NAD(P)-binding protein [Pedobacter psychrophilus]OAQ39820.1 hypothetical protein A5893_09600 [Pedobacter psychrophilus]